MKLIYFFALGLGLFTASCATRSLATHPNLQPGDLIFRDDPGIQPESGIFNRKDHRFTHAGMIGPDLQVIHVHPRENGGSAASVPLSRFVKVADDWAVYRTNLSAEDRQKAALRAQEYVTQKVPFDRGMNMDDSNKLYCSELLWRAVLETTGTNLVPEQPKLFSMRYLPLDRFYLDNPRVSKIYDHASFISASE